ncbi:MAG: hypothetical protein ACRC28_18445 [Clostridium sp.]|uniref:hypothetical protein n=1 Tax=Clostridium sp. TaxID=1506 RepID=UPI003F2FC20D
MKQNNELKAKELFYNFKEGKKAIENELNFNTILLVDEMSVEVRKVIKRIESNTELKFNCNYVYHHEGQRKGNWDYTADSFTCKANKDGSLKVSTLEFDRNKHSKCKTVISFRLEKELSKTELYLLQSLFSEVKNVSATSYFKFGDGKVNFDIIKKW